MCKKLMMTKVFVSFKRALTMFLYYVDCERHWWRLEHRNFSSVFEWGETEEEEEKKYFVSFGSEGETKTKIFGVKGDKFFLTPRSRRREIVLIYMSIIFYENFFHRNKGGKLVLSRFLIYRNWCVVEKIDFLIS